MQFTYDASGVGTPTDAWLCVTLGVWHPYKQANSVVWSHWGPRFLAPYHIVPGSNFSTGARLITIISYFTYIRLTAPSFAVQLQDAIKAARALRERPLALAYLLDLRTLVFFCIPVVTTLHLDCMWVVWRCVTRSIWRAMHQRCVNINASPRDHSLCININGLCHRLATTAAR